MASDHRISEASNRPRGSNRYISRAAIAFGIAWLVVSVAGAEERAFVLDAKGQTAVVLDLATGAPQAKAKFDTSPTTLLRTGDGARLVAIDSGPHTATFCCGLKPKGPMVATILDAKTLASAARVTVGHGVSSLSVGGMDFPMPFPLIVPSVDGRRLSIVCAGYRSNKPEETLAREMVTLDTASGQVVGRVPLDRAPQYVWRVADSDTAVLVTPGLTGKNPLLAEVLFVDLVGHQVVERLTLPAAAANPFVTPDAKWLYLLDPGQPPGKNANGHLHVVSLTERKVSEVIDVGSNPRAFSVDDARGQVLLVSDGPSVPKGQRRRGELRLLRNGEVRAMVNVASEPHLVRVAGQRAFVAGESALTIVSLEDAQRLKDLVIDDASSIDDIAFSKDMRRGFALFAASDRLTILDLETPRVMGSVTTGRGGVKFAKALGAAALSVAGTAASYTAGMQQAQTQGRSWFIYNIYNFGVAAPETAVVARPDGAIAYALNSQTNDISIVDIEKAFIVSKEPAEARGLSLFPDGNRVAILGKDELRFIDTATNRLTEPLRFEGGAGVRLVFTRDGSTALAWAGKDLYVLDAHTASVRAKVGGLLSVSTVLFDSEVASAPVRSVEASTPPPPQTTKTEAPPPPPATGQASALKIGMTFEEVEALLGQPKWRASFEQTARWEYPDVTVIFENGRIARLMPR